MNTESNPESAEVGAGGGSVEDCVEKPSPVRERTLKHMRELLAKSAVAGGALSLTGCPLVVCDPLPPPIVVDPRPTPAECDSDLIAEHLFEWASWQARWAPEGKGYAIDLSLFLWVSELTFLGEPALEGATLVDGEVLEGELTVMINPLEGATKVTVLAPVKCGEASAALRLVLDVSGPPQPGEAVPVAIGD